MKNNINKYEEALNLQKLIDKEIAITSIGEVSNVDPITYDNIYALKCPRCGNHLEEGFEQYIKDLIESHSENALQYCFKCGQKIDYEKIDWSGEDE